MNVEPRHPSPLPGMSIRTVRYPADCRQGRHHHDRTSVTLVYGGSLDEVVGGAREEAGPLSVVYKPAGTEHANRMGPRGAATIQIAFEDSFFEADGADAPEGWGWAHGGPPARSFLGLVRCWSEGGGRAGDMELRLVELLADLPESEYGTAGATDRDGPPAWLARVAEELEDTFRSPRLVRELARDAGVHPVALARAHRRHFGRSITERIRRRRVSEAAALLTSPDRALTSVAYTAGFADQSHLTRVFRSETGLTPGVYRGMLGD
jgi:AraC family transcriptional regulator